MSLALLFHYLLLNMFRMLIHPSSGACDLFDALFHGLCCSGSMCVGVTFWFGWGGVVSGCRLKHLCGSSELPIMVKLSYYKDSRDSSVGIATGYRLDGPGIES